MNYNTSSCLLDICISSSVIFLFIIFLDFFKQILISVSSYLLLLLHLWCYHYILDSPYLILNHGIILPVSIPDFFHFDPFYTLLPNSTFENTMLLLSRSRTYYSSQLFIYQLNSTALFRRKLIPFLDISWRILFNLGYWCMEPICS